MFLATGSPRESPSPLPSPPAVGSSGSVRSQQDKPADGLRNPLTRRTRHPKTKTHATYHRLHPVRVRADAVPARDAAGDGARPGWTGTGDVDAGRRWSLPGERRRHGQVQVDDADVLHERLRGHSAVTHALEGKHADRRRGGVPQHAHPAQRNNLPNRDPATQT